VSGGQDNFKTPLHTSAEHGFLSNVKALVEAGADVFRLEGRALTPAELALRGGHTQTHQYLLSVVNRAEEAREALHQSLREAVTRGEEEGLRKLLLPLPTEERKDLLNKTPHGTNTLLFKYIRNLLLLLHYLPALITKLSGIYDININLVLKSESHKSYLYKNPEIFNVKPGPDAKM
jgi:hypothetical protein